MSLGLMNKLKWGDSLRVNGQPQRTNYAVKPGDEIWVLMDEETPDYPAENGDLRVLYEDAHILVVDKPAGMLIHPSRSRNTGTLANLVLGYYRRTGQNSAFHPLTRLDRDTFGLVLLGKNAYIHNLLQQTPVKKCYHALIWGTFPQKQGTIDAPIARRPLPSLLREVRADGKPSVTKYRVLECRDGISKVALYPVTGRTHQLRVHCAYMGCPILGDPQYGNEASLALGYPHQQLCAKELTFHHPVTGEVMQLMSAMEVKKLSPEGKAF